MRVTVHESMAQALRELPCASGHAPLGARPDTYVSWFEVLAQPALDASDRPRRLAHTLQVDLYSRNPTDTLLAALLTALRRGGFRIASYGPEDYEDDTRFRHMPVTVRFYTAIDETEG